MFGEESGSLLSSNKFKDKVEIQEKIDLIELVMFALLELVMFALLELVMFALLELVMFALLELVMFALSRHRHWGTKNEQ